MPLRFLFLLAFCVAIALLSLPERGKSVLVQTGRDLDIAIAGRGYFCALDEDLQEIVYTRTGMLVVDADGQVRIDVDGKRRLIDPPILIPPDSQRITVLPKGEVQTLLDSTWITMGQIQIAVFSAVPPFDASLAANLESSISGPPLLDNPGFGGTGVIQQGWIEQAPSGINQIATRLLLAILASAVLWRSTVMPSRSSSESILPTKSPGN